MQDNSSKITHLKVMEPPNITDKLIHPKDTKINRVIIKDKTKPPRILSNPTQDNNRIPIKVPQIRLLMLNPPILLNILKDTPRTIPKDMLKGTHPKPPILNSSNQIILNLALQGIVKIITAPLCNKKLIL